MSVTPQPSAGTHGGEKEWGWARKSEVLLSAAVEPRWRTTGVNVNFTRLPAARSVFQKLECFVTPGIGDYRRAATIPRVI